MSQRSPQEFRIELVKSALDSISIPPGVFRKAQERYESVTRFLDDPKTLVGSWHPDMYVQGSAALGVANRPLDKDDFDFDVTCETRPPSGMSAMQVRKAVEDRLLQDSNYSRMLNTEKNRCLCLDYAKDEKFHLDIVVARSASWVNATGTGIQVPDRTIASWIGNDPKGFIVWFNARRDLAQFAPLHTMVNDGWMQFAASADPAPQQPSSRQKRPLQWVVQIMKRHRDLMFQHDGSGDAPISIILTTLAAKAYQGESNLDDALGGVASRLLQQFDDDEMWEVRNPCIPAENFADKWSSKPQRREAFFRWHWQFVHDAKVFLGSTKIENFGTALESLVGSHAKIAAFNAHAGMMNEMQRAGQLAVLGGAAELVPSTVFGSKVIPNHNNFGTAI